MTTQEQNKAFILRYFDAISGNVKTRELNEQFMTDENLINHIAFFEAIFPRYEIFADEMMAEGKRVMVRARCKAIHQGEFNGIPPTNKNVEFPFVIQYTIEDGTITDHWLISDQMELMQQLGVVESEPANTTT